MFKGGKSDKPKDKEPKGKESKKDVKDKKLHESDTEDSSSGMCRCDRTVAKEWRGVTGGSVFVCDGATLLFFFMPFQSPKLTCARI